jgi:hypothetical protein
MHGRRYPPGRQAEAAGGEAEPSVTGRRWVAPPPTVLASSDRRTRPQRPRALCLAQSGWRCRLGHWAAPVAAARSSLW